MRRLFNTHNIRRLMDHHWEQARIVASALEDHELANDDTMKSSIEAVVGAYTLYIPELDTDAISVHSHEEKVGDRSVQKIVFDVPYAGDGNIFLYSPTVPRVQIPSQTPLGNVGKDKVSFEVRGTQLEPDEVVAFVSDMLGSFGFYLRLLREQCTPWNSRLETEIARLADERRQTLANYRQVMESIVERRAEGFRLCMDHQAA